MSRPNMQQIADAMSTSRITVWKALNNRPGVSKELRKKIIEKSQEMGYQKAMYVNSDLEKTTQEQTPKTIAAVISRPESSIFWMQIIHQIAKELSKQGINLLYTYLPTYYKEGSNLPTTLTEPNLSGMIILNVYSVEFLQKLSQLPIPKVFLDTVPTLPFDKLNGDLLMIEGRSKVCDITLSIIDKGIKDIVFVGDIDYAQTNTDRFLGFKDAMSMRNIKINKERCLTDHIGLNTHYEEISKFLDKLNPFPEAIVCASDYIAHFIKRYCMENENEKTKNVIITGFDNNKEYVNVAESITTVNVQTDTLGKRLANKILFRLKNTDASYELSYVSSEILYCEPLLKDD